MRNYTLIAGLILVIAGAAQAESDAMSPPPGGHDFGHHMFEKMDADNDGNISREEHEQGLQQMLEKRRTHFASMDTDGNGQVSKDEAQATGGKMRDKYHEKRRDCGADTKK